MATRTDVINDALNLLDQPDSTGPNDTSSWVRKVSNRYDGVARRLLSDHPWNFAEERVELELLDETPIGWEYSYNKPGDCLRINKVSDTGIKSDSPFKDYDDSKGRIMTNLSTVYLFYISDQWVTLEGSWPPLFAYAVSTELAFLVNGPVTKSRTKGVDLRAEAKNAFRKAKTWDAQQKPSEELPHGRWVRSMSARRSAENG